MKGDIYLGGLENETDSGVEVMVKEELCEVVKVISVSDSVMAVVLVFYYVLRLICVYAPQSERNF